MNWQEIDWDSLFECIWNLCFYHDRASKRSRNSGRFSNWVSHHLFSDSKIMGERTILALACLGIESYFRNFLILFAKHDKFP